MVRFCDSDTSSYCNDYLGFKPQINRLFVEDAKTPVYLFQLLFKKKLKSVQQVFAVLPYRQRNKNLSRRRDIFVVRRYVLCGDFMNFAIYEEKFRKEALKLGKSSEYVNSCLDYARILARKGIPVIYDQEHFSKLVGIKLEVLLSISNCPRPFYRYFTIPKNNGKVRKIAEPLPALKEVQHFILKNVLEKVPCSTYAKAYRAKISLKSNAKFHRNQAVLVKMDLQDYFPNLHASRVYQLFHNEFGYSESVSMLLTGLCTLNEGLPQGAPTSPYLSNLLTVDLDEAIANFCKDNGKLRYTRYADDISISGTMDPKRVICGVSRIISDYKLKVNKEKTVVVRQHDRQIVTGIVVNQKLQAPKSYRKNIRLEMHYCMKYGVDNHIQRRSKELPKPISRTSYLQSLLGRVNYCLQINRKDLEMQTYKEYLLQEFHK